MWDKIRQEHSYLLWILPLGPSEKAKIRNPVCYAHKILDKSYWLNHVLVCWDVIEHIYIWEQKLYFLLY